MSVEDVLGPRPDASKKNVENLLGSRPGGISTSNGSAPAVNGPPVPLEDQPGKEYGNILPFAKDTKTGKLEFAFPEIIREPVRIMARGSQEIRGERPIDPRDALSGAMLGVGSPVAATGALRGAETLVKAKPLPQVLAESKVALDAAETPMAASNAMKKVSQAYYAEGTKQGGALTPSFSKKFVDSLRAMGPQTEAGQATVGDTALTQLLARYEKAGLGEKPLTLEAAQDVDEGLGQLISKEYGVKGLSKEGKDLLEAQHDFRDLIENAELGDVYGGKEGFEAWKTGRTAWAQAAKMRDVEQLWQRSIMSQQPITVWQTGIKNILTTPKKLRGFTQAEQAALREAMKTGPTTAIFRTFGSGLIPHVAASASGVAADMLGGGVPGAFGGLMLGEAAGKGLSAAARGIATARQGKKVDKLLDTLNRVPRASLGEEAEAPQSLAEMAQ